MIEIINNFQLGISIMLQPATMALMVVGVAVGLVGGALPGITGSITMALTTAAFKLSSTTFLGTPPKKAKARW